MPDDGPGADQQEHEVDELAKGLVGSPIRLNHWRVNSSGFHRMAGLLRRERHVAWASVTAVYGGCLGLIVEGRRPGRYPGKLLEIHGSLAAIRAVVAAWSEYSDRRIEREGCLRGERSRPLVRSQAVLISCAVLLLGLALCVALTFPWGRVHYSMDGFRMVEPLTRRRVVTIWLAVASFGLGGVGLSLVIVLRTRRAWSLRRRWSRWELSRDGLTFWPDGTKTVLVPARGDTITPQEAVIGGECVPLQHMTYPLASQLLMAMGERHGAVLRRSRSFWLVPALVFGSALSVGAALLEQGPDRLVLGVYALAALVVVTIEVVALAKQPEKLLFHGRAMLERLGW